MEVGERGDLNSVSEISLRFSWIQCHFSGNFTQIFFLDSVSFNGNFTQALNVVGTNLISNFVASCQILLHEWLIILN